MRADNADFFRVSGEYALILPHERYLTGVFGPTWKTEPLYYGCNRALNEAKKEVLVTTATLLPLAEGAPVLTISGSDWRDISCIVFSTGSRKEAVFRIDLVQPRMELVGPVATRPENFEVLGDGRLSFKPAS